MVQMIGGSPERLSERVSERLSERVSKRLSERLPEQVPPDIKQFIITNPHFLLTDNHDIINSNNDDTIELIKKMIEHRDQNDRNIPMPNYEFWLESSYYPKSYTFIGNYIREAFTSGQGIVLVFKHGHKPTYLNSNILYGKRLFFRKNNRTNGGKNRKKTKRARRSKKNKSQKYHKHR